MRAEIFPARVEEVLARRADRIAYVFAPDAIGDGSPVVRASNAGVPVHLAPHARWPEGVLERLAEHFLYREDLRVPVEPFASVARAIARGRGPDLWHAYHEVLGRGFFVDREGRVTLSERWARRDRFFGTVADDLDVFEASDLWREVASWRERVFAEVGACATCAHFPACGGFWLAIGDDEAACLGWQRALGMLTDAWRAHRDDLTADADG